MVKDSSFGGEEAYRKIPYAGSGSPVIRKYLPQLPEERRAVLVAAREQKQITPAELEAICREEGQGSFACISDTLPGSPQRSKEIFERYSRGKPV